MPNKLPEILREFIAYHARRRCECCLVRRDKWEEHFAQRGIVIDPLTAKGAATVRLLKLNHPQRLAEREQFAAVSSYPGNREM